MTRAPTPVDRRWRWRRRRWVLGELRRLGQRVCALPLPPALLPGESVPGIKERSNANVAGWDARLQRFVRACNPASFLCTECAQTLLPSRMPAAARVMFNARLLRRRALRTFASFYALFIFGSLRLESGGERVCEFYVCGTSGPVLQHAGFRVVKSEHKPLLTSMDAPPPYAAGARCTNLRN